MAPMVVNNKVFVGNSGGEMGGRGWLTALDAGTGEIAWRAYSTGPDGSEREQVIRSLRAKRENRHSSWLFL